MKVLITYASFHGQTQTVAEWTARWFEDHHASVTLVDCIAEEPRGPFSTYDLIVLMAPVHIGRHHPAMVRFVRRHAGELNACPTSFVSVSGAAASQKPEAIPQAKSYADKLFRETGLNPARVMYLGGAYPFTKYTPVLRLLMSWIAKSAGMSTDTTRDHVYTDYAALGRFLQSVAPELHLTELPKTVA